MKKAIYLILILISLIILTIRFASVPLSRFLGFKDRAGLRVLSVPEGVDVFVNQSPVGKTPYEDTSLKAEEYTISLQSPEASWSGKVKLQGATLTVVNRELSKDLTSSSGEVLTLEKGSGATIISNPGQADIEIDGQLMGKSPLVVNVVEGEHTFVLSKDNYLKRSIKALVPAGYNLHLNVDLALSQLDLTTVQTPPIQETKKVVIKSTPNGFLRVRDKPATTGQEIARVSSGDELVMLEELTDWFKIRLPNGQEGYVSAVYVTKKN